MIRFKTTALAAGAAALAVGGTTALAGSGVGGIFNLGQTNTVGGTSTLTGETAAPQLTVKNTNANTSATALNLSVAAGRTPFKVNSAVKVSNLNADQLDGKDSTAFYGAGSKVANADKLRWIFGKRGQWELDRRDDCRWWRRGQPEHRHGPLCGGRRWAGERGRSHRNCFRRFRKLG